MRHALVSESDPKSSESEEELRMRLGFCWVSLLLALKGIDRTCIGRGRGQMRPGLHQAARTHAHPYASYRKSRQLTAHGDHMGDQRFPRNVLFPSCLRPNEAALDTRPRARTHAHTHAQEQVANSSRREPASS